MLTKVVSPMNNWLNPTSMSHTQLVLMYVRTYSLSGGLSVGTVFVPAIFWSCSGRIGLKYVPVIRNGHYYCSFGTSSTRTTILVCKTLHEIEFWLRKKYWSFVSGHLAKQETEWPKKIQVTKWIQVASTINHISANIDHQTMPQMRLPIFSTCPTIVSVGAKRKYWFSGTRW